MLRENLELRNSGIKADGIGFGRAILQVPQLDLQRLWRKYPDLNCLDADIKTKAWLKFAASSESEPYRLQQRPVRRK